MKITILWEKDKSQFPLIIMQWESKFACLFAVFFVVVVVVVFFVFAITSDAVNSSSRLDKRSETNIPLSPMDGMKILKGFFLCGSDKEVFFEGTRASS